MKGLIDLIVETLKNSDTSHRSTIKYPNINTGRRSNYDPDDFKIPNNGGK